MAIVFYRGVDAIPRSALRWNEIGWRKKERKKGRKEKNGLKPFIPWAAVAIRVIILFNDGLAQAVCFYERHTFVGSSASACSSYRCLFLITCFTRHWHTQEQLTRRALRLIRASFESLPPSLSLSLSLSFSFSHRCANYSDFLSW